MKPPSVRVGLPNPVGLGKILLKPDEGERCASRWKDVRGSWRREFEPHMCMHAGRASDRHACFAWFGWDPTRAKPAPAQSSPTGMSSFFEITIRALGGLASALRSVSSRCCFGHHRSVPLRSGHRSDPLQAFAARLSMHRIMLRCYAETLSMHACNMRLHDVALFTLMCKSQTTSPQFDEIRRN